MNKPLVPALAVLLAASPALSLPVGPALLAGPAAQLQYAAAAQSAGVSVARTQFAIIHLLADYKSPNHIAGRNDFLDWHERDRSLLQEIERKAGVRIEVTPLDPVNLRLLWEEARLVRAAHNEGKPLPGRAPNARKRPISAGEMQDRHAAIIARYSSHVKVVPVGGTAPVTVEERLRFTEESFAEANRLYVGLRMAVEHMAAAKDEEGFKVSVERFNALAARYQEGVRVEWTPADGAAGATAALQRAQDYERRQLARLREMGEYLGHPARFNALEPVKATGAFFDGARGAAASPVRPGEFRNVFVPAAQTAAASQALAPAVADVPAPGEKKTEQKPGLFAMLGSLLGKFFTGLLRTVQRVGAAVLKSAGLIAKAAFS